MYIYHNLFIHSSVNGHLGCSHVLAIVNSAEINNGMHVSLSILRIYDEQSVVEHRIQAIQKSGYSNQRKKVKSLSHVRLFATPWTIAYQAPLSMGFSRQEYWSGLPFLSPVDLPNPGFEPGSQLFKSHS